MESFLRTRITYQSSGKYSDVIHKIRDEFCYRFQYFWKVENKITCFQLMPKMLQTVFNLTSLNCIVSWNEIRNLLPWSFGLFIESNTATWTLGERCSHYLHDCLSMNELHHYWKETNPKSGFERQLNIRVESCVLRRPRLRQMLGSSSATANTRCCTVAAPFTLACGSETNYCALSVVLLLTINWQGSASSWIAGQCVSCVFNCFHFFSHGSTSEYLTLFETE
jgi:hypothetical protein